jgi:hypothetical protein
MQIQSLVDIHVSSREQKKITSWQASQVGGCLSGVFLARLGVKPLEDITPQVMRKFHCGNLFEEYIVERVKKANLCEVETQVRVENPELGVTGYADMVLNWDNYKEVIEVKSQHSKSFWYMIKKGQGAYEHHMMQLFLYMITLKVDKGRLVYVSKDDLTIQEFPYHIDDSIMQKVATTTLNNLDILNEALRTNVMPAPAPEGSFQAKYCRFHAYCTGELPLPLITP